MQNTFVNVWIHLSIHHFMLLNLFHPWFQNIISRWQNIQHIEVSQLMIFVQTMVPQILFQLFHGSSHNISIQITLKHRLKHYLNLFMSPFQKFLFFICLKFFSYDAYGLNPLDKVTNSIHVDPAHFDKYGKEV